MLRDMNTYTLSNGSGKGFTVEPGAVVYIVQTDDPAVEAGDEAMVEALYRAPDLSPWATVNLIGRCGLTGTMLMVPFSGLEYSYRIDETL